MESSHLIVATAGHVDHGKTALVKALTGIDADTLPEEKRRGLTIELGFVFLDVPGLEKPIVFIDCPGHEKFVRTMVAGAANVDAALLVVAADEGIAVQTREHLEILHLLGVREGLIVLTKCDLAGPERRADLIRGIREFVDWTFLKHAPVISTSAVSGEGVDELRSALLKIEQRLQGRSDSGLFRMPVDRVFSIRGFGTVIAGTVLSGEVRVGDRIEVYPEGLIARVRGVQVHGRSRDNATVGLRTALNLTDVKKEDLYRGQTVGPPGKLLPAFRLDTRLYLLQSWGKNLKQRSRVRMHVGTDEKIGRVVLLDREVLLPGQSGFVQFVLEAPTVVFPGDTFVIRSFSPVVTIGGGRILDADASRRKRMDPETLSALEKLDGPLDGVLEQMVFNSGFMPLSQSQAALALGRGDGLVEKEMGGLAEAGRLVPVSYPDGVRYLHPRRLQALREKFLQTVRDFFRASPHLRFMPVADLRARVGRFSDLPVFRLLLEEFLRRMDLVQREEGIELPGRAPDLTASDRARVENLERWYREAGYAAPLPEDVRSRARLTAAHFDKLMKYLVESGRLVRLSPKVTYHRDVLEKIWEMVAQDCRELGSITIARLRDRLGLSRKYAQAVLEYFDREGRTLRRGDQHVLK